jgi:NADH-quinone oxidoreductase subunit D
VGEDLSDVLITLAAVDPCYCCTERSVRMLDDNNKEITNDLLSRSHKKTEKLIEELGENEIWKQL